MTHLEAKRTLSIYRPGIDDNDPEVREALCLLETDSELKAWFEEHQRFQNTVRTKFQKIAVPTRLRSRILAEQKVVRPSFFSKSNIAIAIAAAIILFIGIGVLFHSRTSDHFADYESRMVRGALREYRMDLVTNDLAQIRLSMASRGAPSEFFIPKGLSNLRVVGGGALKWRSNPVTMVCFDRGDKQMLFFFVLDRTAVKDFPAQTPAIRKISRLQSASWTKGDKVYVLAGPEDPNFAQKYL